MNELENACKGKTWLNGGLYVGDLRKRLIDKFPRYAQAMEFMSRKDLEDLCLKLLQIKPKEQMRMVVQPKRPVEVKTKRPVEAKPKKTSWSQTRKISWS